MGLTASYSSYNEAKPLWDNPLSQFTEASFAGTLHLFCSSYYLSEQALIGHCNHERSGLVACLIDMRLGQISAAEVPSAQQHVHLAAGVAAVISEDYWHKTHSAVVLRLGC